MNCLNQHYGPLAARERPPGIDALAELQKWGKAPNVVIVVGHFTMGCAFPYAKVPPAVPVRKDHGVLISYTKVPRPVAPRCPLALVAK